LAIVRDAFPDTLRRPGGREPFVRRTAIWIPVVVIALLALPMALTSRSFGSDWTLHLWLVRQQQWNIEAMGHPGLFVSAKPLGAFYPMFAFVGSGIYSFGAYVAIVLGDRPILAYKLLYVSGLCLGYGGFTWLSVQRGLRGWRSQMAGLVFVTDAYFVTDLAGRGDLGEFMALAAIPFLLAATYAVVTSPTVRLRNLLAVVVAVFVFTGSHNITLLWGSLFIAMLGLLVLATYRPRFRPRAARKRACALLGCAAIGVGLNAWYLFPDVAYSLHTSVAKVSHGRLPTVDDRFRIALDPFRPAYSGVYRDVRMSLPWLFAVWALLLGVVLWRGRNRASKKLFVGLAVITGAHVVLVFAQVSWRWLPHLLWNVQFSWRLGAYVLLGTALLVMLALEAHGTARRAVRSRAAIALAVILVFNVGAATWQVWRVRSSYVHSARNVPTSGSFVDTVVAAREVTPPSWRDFGSFRDVSSPQVSHEAGRVMIVPLAAVHGSKFVGVLDVPDGPAPFNTNISAGPRFVRMTGIRAVGRTTRGFIVAERDRRAPLAGPIAVTIGPAHTTVLRAGAITSLVSAAALVALLGWPLRRVLRPVSRVVPTS
jgi:hypothetical protein